ncbi:MAG: hypothetical protein ACTS6G_03810 [Candidatus Hodgkinia cicadicola]
MKRKGKREVKLNWNGSSINENRRTKSLKNNFRKENEEMNESGEETAKRR